MLYFSPLSVTDDKQLDRKHPFSFPQCRQGRWVGGWVGGWVGPVFSIQWASLVSRGRCVCLLLQDLLQYSVLQSCSRGGEEESGTTHVL